MICSANKHLANSLKPNSAVLASIEKAFDVWIKTRNQKNRPINIVCFYEELPMPGIGIVVDYASATIPGHQSFSIHATNEGMLKFKHKDDNGYIRVAGELRRFVDDIHEMNDEDIPGKRGTVSTLNTVDVDHV
ncbi:hypothetical protein BDV25DRAFT_140386 [Aspergillus avenaceus]|uniref:Uncharacterized protein n=1 Tax=Aspergillus avenaceus TaxID=36643 RepID=A0A5N6TU36_ASPAV|nr:hypothetical protein BDV25DRAFT_140386 [Aspergillus avenaceus]